MTVPATDAAERGTQSYALANKRVWVAGHKGMVGSALVRRLGREGCEVVVVERSEADLRDQQAVSRWMAAAKPDAVFLAAATVGGIYANDSRPAEFLYDNLAIEANVIEAAHRNGVAKLMLLGSTCIYPRLAPQPMPEEALLTGPLESTNEWYAIAKIAGIKLCQAYRRQYGSDFIAVMPTNLYGPGDNFNLERSHVVPALMRKAHEAKRAAHTELVVWGSGSPRREFLHVDDMADACVFIMKTYSGESHLNIGTGEDLTIAELARTVAEVVGFQGEIVFDKTKPDGTPRKLTNVDRLHRLGWSYKITLEAGLSDTYEWFCENIARIPASRY